VHTPPPHKTPSRRPIALFLAAVAAAAAAVSFASAMILGQRDLWRRHAALEAEQLQWVVFLKDGADRAPVEEVLRTLPGVKSLRFVSKDEALESAKADPVLSESLALAGGNPFPESFVVHWDPLFIREDLLGHHAARLTALPAVDRVEHDGPRTMRFSLSQKALSRLDLAVETLTAVAAGLLLAMAGRLLFFSSEPFSPVFAGGGLVAAAAGAGGGFLAALWLGAPGGWFEAAAGFGASCVLALGAEAFRS
jgi:cell division protein FtsX